jgi:hypothetical protein
MTTQQDKPLPISGDTKQKLTGRKCKELDGQTAAMLESQEVKAIEGDGEEWWCPNPGAKLLTSRLWPQNPNFAALTPNRSGRSFSQPELGTA